MCAKVDVDDFASLSVLRWCLFKDGDRRYAYRFVTGLDGRRERRWMHRDILGVAPNPLLEVDHIDGDGLNNQRLNLRWTTKSYNQQNRRLSGGTSRLRGVRFKPNGRPWVAQIKHNGKLFHIGRYETETDAAVAYDTKAKELFGEHARTNFESC